MSIFKIALSFVEQYPQGGLYECYVDGKLKLKGKSTAITNPSIEMGLIHSRVLLEFLGLKANKAIALCAATPRKTDISIESFGLPKVSIAEALAPCKGDKEKAMRSFAQTITAANKLVAHSTDTIEMDHEAIDSYLMCCSAIPVLFNLHFYIPMGLSMPDIEIESERATPKS
ncbi:MAG: hypothetical protein GY807_01870 [Gammaproteobacteria bacterium]|nr:hypothetical protein [Gammaproteobacteria bacterium]